MMNPSHKFLRGFAVLAGALGASALVSLPSLAQGGMTAPTNPSVPSNTTPSNTLPSSPDPSNTLPSNPNPSNTLPSNPNTLPPRQTAPSEVPSPAQSPNQANTRNVVELATQSGSFNTLVRAVQAAGLTQRLANGGPYTIFAPTDQAFAALPPGTLEALLRPENRALLTRVLSYHVVPRELTSDAIRTGTVPNLSGGALAVRVTPERIIVNDGSVTQPDLEASNGVIHGVNRVLLPRELRQQLGALAAR